MADGVTLDEAERFGARIVRSGQQAIAEAAVAADVVLVAVGNDPHLAGRETADRPHLMLPEVFAEVWRIARRHAEQVVLTIVSSYPYVLGDAFAAETIVWSSHGGQELGNGLVDVLSGDVEPTGRLAQSWPADPAQAGDLFDYDTLRQQATYRHHPEPYAFAFGHGCTYSAVRYEDVQLSEPQVAAPEPTHHHPALVAYERVRLEPGESREVELSFDARRLAVWDDELRIEGAPEDWVHAGALRVQPGAYRIAAGPSADALEVDATLTVAVRS
ncbi:glycoside hydrolase family 3 C-terminal domain-containing protein [Microbacterium amylolyticum]|uniref:Fibronectin type III-like domain-containing protein n=1 Tax=Microbacterium amylolyticum TaxID=936337 RepID=A0ABS4ZIW8_9MICO|nr:glycoside hydrolase family 3 C-terminal domain-containing protein [Microbacterium amylolyticum]MBP2437225.1 hypothetical protein [Microbacterium amylolyticum]